MFKLNIVVYSLFLYLTAFNEHYFPKTLEHTWVTAAPCFLTKNNIIAIRTRRSHCQQLHSALPAFVFYSTFLCAAVDGSTVPTTVTEGNNVDKSEAHTTMNTVCHSWGLELTLTHRGAQVVLNPLNITAQQRCKSWDHN